jgi:hypothetical protein
VRGLLMRVDCEGERMTLTVRAGDRTLRFQTSMPERLQYVTYTQEVGEMINCGPQEPAVMVVVTYRSSTDAGSHQARVTAPSEADETSAAYL